MKKCPFCGADIEENARFCLYCMKSFNSKVEVKSTNKKSKRWLIVLTAFLLLLSGIIVCFFLCGDRNNDGSADTDYNSGTVAEGTSIPSSEGNTTLGTNNVSQTGNDTTKPNDNITTESEGLTTGTDTDTTPTATNPINNQPELSLPANQTVTESITVTPSVPETTEGTPPSQNEIPEKINWTYRKATTYDYYKNYNKIEATDAIIITGFTNIPANGIYDVPEKIDGKVVVGIDMSDSSAYTFNSAGASVKKIYLPKHLNKINGNIFSACTNITDIYIKGSYLYMEPSALPEKSSRKCNITVHSTDDCWCLYGAKYMSVYCSPYGPNEYYAHWAELY